MISNEEPSEHLVDDQQPRHSQPTDLYGFYRIWLDPVGEGEDGDGGGGEKHRSCNDDDDDDDDDNDERNRKQGNNKLMGQ